jgi:hypothetical protein
LQLRLYCQPPGDAKYVKIMHGHCVTASGIENRNIAKENEAKRPLKTSHGIPTFWLYNALRCLSKADIAFPCA